MGRKELTLQFLASGDKQGGQPQGVPTQHAGYPATCGTQLLVEEAPFQRSQPGTSVLLWGRIVEEAELEELLHDLVAVSLLLVEQGGDGCDLPGGKLPDQVPQGFLRAGSVAAPVPECAGVGAEEVGG